jgi:hypothetical protein
LKQTLFTVWGGSLRIRTPKKSKFNDTPANPMIIENNVFEQLGNSTHREIKICGENLLKLNKDLNQSEFVHKTTAFKRLDRDLFKMMVRLDNIDVDENPQYSEERKLALTKIHDMNKLLDSKVKCKLDDCIICKTGIELKEDNPKV